MIGIFVVYLVLVIVTGFVAEQKGRSFLSACLLSLLLSPLVGLVIILLLGKDETRLCERGKAKRCPHCMSIIDVRATACRHCSREVTPGYSAEYYHRGFGYIIGQLSMLIVLLGLITVGVAIWRDAQERENGEPVATATAPAPEPIHLRSDTPITVEEAKRQAVAQFPDLARADSPLNRRFLELVRHKRSENPLEMKDPAWPLRIAEEAAKGLNNPSATLAAQR